MRSLLFSFALVVASAAQASPVGGFSGAYAPANWTISEGTGSVDAFTASLLSLRSGNDQSETSSYTDVFIQVTADTEYSFSWDYSSTDSDAVYDPFGVIWSHDGVNFGFTQLTDNVAGTSQSGMGRFTADAGTWFGFRAWTLDNLGGGATTSITNFAAVPEPSSYGLAAVALIALAAHRRKGRHIRFSTRT